MQKQKFLKGRITNFKTKKKKNFVKANEAFLVEILGNIVFVLVVSFFPSVLGSIIVLEVGGRRRSAIWS